MSKLHWVALSRITGVGGVTARRLIERFGSVEAVFSTPPDDLRRVRWLSAETIERLQSVSFDKVEQELAALAEDGIEVVTWDDDAYPANLRQTRDAPPVLFVRGSLQPEDADAVAIVGTREPSATSAQLAEELARDLAKRGLTIVSGLAIGIDTAAHRGALQAATGRTLAVPGSGLQAIYPAENAGLADEIARRGAVLTELPPHVPASGVTLTARDRIISGLSRAVIVVEARERSGSLDTAAKARDQGRLLIAVPGSPGTRQLLEQGALMLNPRKPNLGALVRQIRAHPIAANAQQRNLSVSSL